MHREGPRQQQQKEEERRGDGRREWREKWSAIEVDVGVDGAKKEIMSRKVVALNEQPMSVVKIIFIGVIVNFIVSRVRCFVLLVNR